MGVGGKVVQGGLGVVRGVLARVVRDVRGSLQAGQWATRTCALGSSHLYSLWLYLLWLRTRALGRGPASHLA